jgi:pilus assembly protein CpaF
MRSLIMRPIAMAPCEEFFEDPQISEIMINGPHQIFVEKHGKLILTDAKYDSELQLRLAINHIINPFGRYVNYKHPWWMPT